MIQSVSEKLREFIFIGYKIEQYELCMDLLMICCICPLWLRAANDFQRDFKLKKLETVGAESHKLLLVLTVLIYVDLEWKGSNCFDNCIEKNEVKFF